MMAEWNATGEPIVNERYGDGGNDDYGYATTMNDELEVKKPQRVRKKDVEQ